MVVKHSNARTIMHWEEGALLAVGCVERMAASESGYAARLSCGEREELNCQTRGRIVSPILCRIHPIFSRNRSNIFIPHNRSVVVKLDELRPISSSTHSFPMWHRVLQDRSTIVSEKLLR